ncbi:MAG: hypothetical protein AB7V11_15905 [Pyrinomonadaceae bacterium]
MSLTGQVARSLWIGHQSNDRPTIRSKTKSETDRDEHRIAWLGLRHANVISC